MPSSEQVLKYSIGFVSLAPVALGVTGLIQGATAWEGANEATIDSNVRFLYSILAGYGLCFFLILPRLLEEVRLLRVLLGALFVGGIARLYVFSQLGAPNLPIVYFVTGVEILAPLIFLPWQAVLAKRNRAA